MKMNILFPEFVDFLNESNADYLNSGYKMNINYLFVAERICNG